MGKHHISADGEAFFDLVDSYLEPEERQYVRHAFALARQEHGDERRKSGELFFTHPLTVAYYLAEYQLDSATLVAALLHDIAEDTRVSVAEIAEQFGDEVGRLVDGLTKFKAVADDAASEEIAKEVVQNATLHKLFGVMTDDVRVGLIKLFDRLHNMRTIEATPPETQRRKAEETLAVYAPLANRLGMWELKNDLESLSLEVLDPEAYQAIQQQLEQLRHQHQAVFDQVSHQIAEQLTKSDLRIVDISLCPENVYSVYQASQKNGQHGHFKIDATLRLVIVLEDVASCYLALGELHQLWRPVPGTFDDYIAAPRENLYRALHTTLIHNNGQRIKVRFRTMAMNLLSEIGVLARWARIGTLLWSREIAERVDILVNSIRENINLEPHDPGLGVQSVVEDVFHDQIVVFTPAGDVKELPQGATPLDFAYMIHSEVGAQCRVALVNDQPVPLNASLQDGDRVKIIKRGHAPQRVWLDEDLGYLTTARARAHVRRWFRRLPLKVAIEEGKQLLEKELEMLGLGNYPHEKIAPLTGNEEARDVYHALGRAELLPTSLATNILRETWDEGTHRNVGSVVYSDEGKRFIIINAGGRPLRFCRSCQPRPDDNIIGFVRADRTVTVHRDTCPRLPLDPFSARTLKLSWGSEETCEVRLFKVRINGYDRAGLLFEISELLQSEQINMPFVQAQTADGHAKVILGMEVFSPRQLVRVLHRIRALVNVYSVVCLAPEETHYFENRRLHAES